MQNYIAILLTVFQYIVFALFMLAALQLLYQGLFSKNNNLSLSKQFITKLKVQQLRLQNTKKQSELTRLFRDAQIPFITNVHFFYLRIIILLILTLYIALTSDISMLLMVVGIYLIMSDPRLKFSIVGWFINKRIKRINYEKENELFTLFAVLKTDVISEERGELNVYDLINRNLPYFKRIEGTLIRFLHNWTVSPEKAGGIVKNELKSESAQFLGDFLAKLHTVSKKDAAHLLEEQGSVFGNARSEILMQRAEVQRNGYYLFFFISVFVSIIWFLWFMADITMSNLTF